MSLLLYFNFKSVTIFFSPFILLKQQKASHKDTTKTQTRGEMRSHAEILKCEDQ